MNKKFMKVSLIIAIPIILIVGFFTMNVNSINDEVVDDNIDEITIEYKGYKESKNFYTLSILVKNNTKNIAALSNMELHFDDMYNEDNVDENGYFIQNNVYIKGQEIDAFDDDKVYGIDPGCEEEVIFNIPKSITFDEEKINTKSPIIDYNVNFYKFRTGPKSLMLGSGGMSGGSRVLNTDGITEKALN